MRAEPIQMHALQQAGICADDPTLACLLREAYQVREAERQVE